MKVLILTLLLSGCSVIARPVAPIGIDTRNCDPSKQADCYAVTHTQLKAMFNRLDKLTADLEQLTAAYTFCKEGI